MSPEMPQTGASRRAKSPPTAGFFVKAAIEGRLSHSMGVVRLPICLPNGRATPDAEACGPSAGCDRAVAEGGPVSGGAGRSADRDQASRREAPLPMAIAMKIPSRGCI
jgi:hypothetical protein